MEQRKKIFLLITDAGGGHRASASSLMAWAEAEKKPWDIRIVNVYREVWDKQEPFKNLFGFYAEDAYNFALKNQLHAWTPMMRVAAYYSSRLPQSAAVAAGAAFLAQEKPDFSISLMPFVNDRFVEMHAKAGIPFGLICTDLMDTKPYMWFSSKAAKECRFICSGSPEATAQAREMGAGERVHETGLVIHPKYFNEDLKTLSRAEARRRFSLDESAFTVSIVMGGYGGKAIRDFVEAFEASGGGWQVVACCGRNEKLRSELEALGPKLKNRLLALGFTDQIPNLMRASDLLITKPGPATLMEAVAVGVPMALDDVGTMPQEVPNADWAQSKGYAIGVKRRVQMFEVAQRFFKDPSLGQGMREKQLNSPLPPSGPSILGVLDHCLSDSTPS